jgi:membrane-associated protein
VDLKIILPAIGILGIFVVVFAESGLLVGFFLPGDSLLFTAGFLASQGIFNIKALVIVCFVAAVAGDSVGYEIGHKLGRKLFQKKESVFFHKDNLLKAEEFYKKHGKKTIILARFVPVIRTFAPIIAGIGNMTYRTFISYNIFGGFLWAVGITSAGYFLGNIVPDVDKYILPIVVFIIVASVFPGIYHVLKDPKQRSAIASLIRAKIFP